MSPTDSALTPLRGLAGIPEVEGDHLNARRFLEAHGDEVRRSPELGRWFTWNGAWWEEDRLDRVLELAASTIDQLRPWVAQADSADEYKRRSAHYTASSKATRRDALLAVAGTDPDVVVGIEQLDAHPMLLACRNGTVDLATGTLRPARPDELLTRGASVDFDPAACITEWEQFISTTFGGDDELIEFVQRLLGYAVTGAVSEHILAVFHGTGANGKSTLLGVIQDLLGGHAMPAPDGLVVAQAHEQHPERIAVLRGRRLVVSSELEASAVLAEAAVKVLTGGDTLSARQLYGQRFTFRPTHKVILVTNHKPKVVGTDLAIWRRLRLVPFSVTMAPEEQDPDLRRRLVEDHGAAVLAWLVAGARNWHSEGLGSAVAVETATADYRSSQDTFGVWLGECTVAIPRTRTKIGALWESWRVWCEQVGERPGRKQDLRSALDGHGVIIETYQGGKFAIGLGIVAADTQLTEQGKSECGEVS